MALNRPLVKFYIHSVLGWEGLVSWKGRVALNRPLVEVLHTH